MLVISESIYCQYYWLISFNLSNSSLDKVLPAGWSHARKFEEQRLHSGRTRGHQSLTGSVNDHQRSSKASTIGQKNQEGPFVKAFSDLSLRFSRAFSKSWDLITMTFGCTKPTPKDQTKPYLRTQQWALSRFNRESPHQTLLVVILELKGTSKGQEKCLYYCARYHSSSTKVWAKHSSLSKIDIDTFKMWSWLYCPILSAAHLSFLVFKPTDQRGVPVIILTRKES